MNKKKAIVFCIFLFLFFGINLVFAYTVKKGDTLWKIAGKLYGNPEYYKYLLQYVADEYGVKNPRELPVGITIPTTAKQLVEKVKDGSGSDNKQKVRKNNSSKSALDTAISISRDNRKKERGIITIQKNPFKTTICNKGLQSVNDLK